MKRFSTSIRTTAITFSVTILVMVMGLVILNRIDFKAAESVSNVYFSPSTPTVAVTHQVSINILASFNTEANLTGAQLSVEFNPKTLQYVATIPPPNWQIVKLIDQPGSLFIVAMPSTQATSRIVANEPMNLSTITFKALADGSSDIRLVPAKTILAVTNNTLGHTIVNGLATVQNALVTSGTNIADSNPNDETKLEVNADPNQAANYGSQRIISDQALLATTSATVLVALQQPAQISVRFGQTKELANSVDYASVTKEAVIKISGLQPAERYYYQVVAHDNDSANQAVGQLQSFQLPNISDQEVVDHAQLVIFPTPTNLSATAYVILYDADNRVVATSEPNFSADNRAVKFGSLGQGGGLYQVPINIQTANKQQASISLAVGGKQLASSRLVIDPNHGATAKTAVASVLAHNRKTFGLVAILVSLLLFLGLSFVKLNRIR